MPSPSPVCTVSDNGGGAQATTNGVNLTTATTTTIALGSTAGVNTWSLTIVGTDELVAAPTVTVNNTNKTATFTAPAIGSALRFQSVVNGGIDVNGQTQASYTTTFEVFTLQSGNRVFATNETTEGNAAFGWITKINPLLRAGGGGGSTPTGTGIPHIVGNVQNGAASLIVNADVDPAAAIVGSKLAASLALTTSVAAGTNAAASGTVRIPNASWITARNAGNSADVNVLEFTDHTQLGDPGNLFYMVLNATTLLSLRTSAGEWDVTETSMQTNLPIIGNNSVTPWAVHGAASSAMTDTNYSETGIGVTYRRVTYPSTLTLTAGRTVTFPAPSTALQGYEKTLSNLTTGGFSLTFTTGAGTTVAIANGKTAILAFSTTGVTRITADV